MTISPQKIGVLGVAVAVGALVANLWNQPGVMVVIVGILLMLVMALQTHESERHSEEVRRGVQSMVDSVSRLQQELDVLNDRIAAFSAEVRDIEAASRRATDRLADQLDQTVVSRQDARASDGEEESTLPQKADLAEQSLHATAEKLDQAALSLNEKLALVEAETQKHTAVLNETLRLALESLHSSVSRSGRLLEAYAQSSRHDQERRDAATNFFRAKLLERTSSRTASGAETELKRRNS